MQGDEIWQRAVVVAAVSAIATLLLWGAGSVAKAEDDKKAADEAAAAQAAKQKQEAADQVAAQKQVVADERQLKIDTRAALAAGQSVDLYKAVKESGWKGYAGERCRNAAINAATFGWEPDQPFTGPTIQQEDAQTVLLVGHDIQIQERIWCGR